MSLHAAAAAQDRTGSLIETSALRALALAASGQEEAAVTALAGTLLLAQRGTSIADRLRHIFADLAAAGFSAAMLVCASVPDLTLAHFEQALGWVEDDPREVVIGPSGDGGCYAIGLAGYAALKVLNPAFYALGDARTPMLVSLGSIVVNFVMATTMIRLRNWVREARPPMRTSCTDCR